MKSNKIFLIDPILLDLTSFSPQVHLSLSLPSPGTLTRTLKRTGFFLKWAKLHLRRRSTSVSVRQTFYYPFYLSTRPPSTGRGVQFLTILDQRKPPPVLVLMKRFQVSFIKVYLNKLNHWVAIRFQFRLSRKWFETTEQITSNELIAITRFWEN